MMNRNVLGSRKGWSRARSVLLGALAFAVLAVPLACDSGASGETGERGEPISGYLPVTPPTTDGLWPAVNPFIEWLDVLESAVHLANGEGLPYFVTFLDDRRVSAVIDGERADVTLTLYNVHEEPLEGTLHVAIRHLDGTLVDQQSVPFSVATGFEPVTLTFQGLPADADMADMAAYAIDYEAQVDAWSRTLNGRRSLFEAVNKLEIQVLTAERYAKGETAFLRLFARNPATGTPAAGAQVRVSLELPDGTLLPVATAETDRFGAVAADLELPETFEGSARLVMEVEDESGIDTAEADVEVLPDVRILLTTDKPLYQPSQTMHLRALVLDRASKQPYVGGEVVFEVMDAAGNKVFKSLQVADEYGIAATTFRLARQVNMGQFRVKAITGEAEQEKEITVERYTLPKFEVEATLDKTYYLPGETVEGLVSAQYFFGQSVNGGQVRLVASTFDVEFTPFAELTGFTNDEGLFPFTFEMPQYVVGSPLEQGAGMVKLDVAVTDTADQEESVSRTTIVSRADVEATLVPESGTLVPGVENVVYVVVSDPMGGAVEADVTVSAGGETSSIALDEQGIGVWTVTPDEVPLDATIAITTPDATDPIELVETLTGGDQGRTILLRTNGALYQVGDTIEVTVLMPTRRERVFLDIIHAGRTVATEAIDVVDGVGTWHFDADNALEGALQLHAYFLGAGSEIIRDERLVYVDPANALNVTLTPDRDIYLPGDPATINVAITDADGQPKAAAMGIQVVDEAVFALQESQPGLLKVYFELEEMLGTPMYQFAWPDLDPTNVIEPPEDGEGPVGGDDTVDEYRAMRAEVSFAAQAGGASAYGVDLNTHRLRLEDVATLVKPFVDADVIDIADELRRQRYEDNLSWDDVNAIFLTLRRDDPWHHPYRVVFKEIQTEDETGWCWFEGENHVFDLVSDGPDEQPDTADDIAVELDTQYLAEGWSCRGNAGGGGWGWEDDMDGAAGGGPPAPNAEPTGAVDEGQGAAQVRVRRWFPETLYVNPAVITDASGEAQIDLTIADSITSWRMSALANSTDGLLGSTTAGMTVFQDFFVDIVFPATLTRGDTVSVPVAIYNYLDIPQTVTLTAQDADWLTFLNGAEVVIPLDPGQVDAIYFEVQVEDVGDHALTVVARGSAMNDAIERTVLVEPDGKEIIDTASARFHTSAPADQIVTEEVAKTIEIPAAAVDGSGVLLVKVYPGFFSQAVEGLDSMLRLPGGCLEQTTSSAWPNVLVMDYMIQSEAITPEIEMKAEQLVNLGYQRILTFECASGGFNWWEGDDPGNVLLSALVAMMLRDTSAVTFVDEAVITRTQAWIASTQRSDGSWSEERHLHAGNETLGTSSLRATAYIVWGLAHSGYDGPAIATAVNWMYSQLESEDDIYTLAMVANALATTGNTGSQLDRILRTLHDARVEDEAGTHWSMGGGDSWCGGGADAGDIEVTALVGLAMLHAHTYSADVEGAMNWLVANKDPQGNWGYSTQATVLTLKLLLESMAGDAGETDADVAVLLGESEIATRHFDNFNKDVLWQVDLSTLAVEGENHVTLRYSGLGNLMYQVVASYHVPWEDEVPSQGSVSIDVAYDKTQLAVNDTVTVNVTVTLHDAGQTGMLLVDLGRPPGFTLHTEDLADLRAAGTIAEYETTDRQILIYLDPLTVDDPKEFAYRLTADYPLEATVPGSSAAPYYDAADRTETPDFGIEVE